MNGHNNMNVLVVESWDIGESVALELIRVSLNSKHNGEDHERRLDKVKVIEGRYAVKGAITSELTEIHVIRRGENLWTELNERTPWSDLRPGLD